MLNKFEKYFVSENLREYCAGLEKLRELHAAGKTEEADKFSENELDGLWKQLSEVDIETLNFTERQADVPNGPTS